MKRNLMTVGLLLALGVVGFAFNAHSVTPVNASAPTVAAGEPAAFAAACGGGATFIKNVRINALNNSDFEVVWDFTPPESCLTPDKFDVTVSVKRTNGNTRTKTVTVSSNARNAIVKFVDPIFAGNDFVTATIKAPISLTPTVSLNKNL